MSKPSITAALDALFHPFNRCDAPGLVVGIAQHGKPMYRRAFGLASVEHAVANTVHTRMRIGSVTKHFTCVAALLLAEEGRLDLDAGVRTWLPELRTEPEPTLRQLMTHTSGLRDSLDLGFLAAGFVLRPPGDALAAQARQSEANFAPGAQMIYSNGAYQMLSLAIERAAGMPFEQFLQQRLFEPLGMHDTLAVPSDFEIHAGMATLHVPQPGGGYRRGMFPSEEVRGEGSIVSTVDDMLRWLAHLRGPHVFGREESWAQMTAPTLLAHGHACAYGLGLLLEPHRGVQVLQHGGTVIGGSCQMLTVPAHALDVILIANGAPVVIAELASRAVEVVLGEEAFAEPAQGLARASDHAALLGARYATPDGRMVIGFADSGGHLGLCLHNSAPLPVVEEVGGGVSLAFSRSVTGPYRLALQPRAPAPDSLVLDDAGTALALERLPTALPPPEAGQVLLGRYRAADLDADALIAFDGDVLTMRISNDSGTHRLRLVPYGCDVFGWHYTAGFLAGMGGTLKVQRGEGRVSGLRLNTLRTRHLHFQRLEG